MTITPFRTALLSATALAGMTMFSATPAAAQEEEAGEAEEIIVTGTRLTTNPNLTAANPVLSVTDEEVEIRGTTRIEDLVNVLPQVFAGQASEVSNGATGTATLNLRGLGAVRTLTLINGRRLPYGDSSTSAANLDLIPAQLVERVDILTGGASAVYGSDAVGGVANFILRDDFNGFELDIQGGFAQNSNGYEPFDSVLRAAEQPVPGGTIDGEEVLLSAIWGADVMDGRGNVTIFASYQNQGEISQGDRSISGCALGPSSGDTSFAGYGCIGSSNFRRFADFSGLPRGNDGVSDVFQEEDGLLVPFQSSPDTTFNFGPFNFFQRPSERFQIFAFGDYEIKENLSVFGEFAYTDNSSDAQIAPSASFGVWEINCSNPLIQDPTGPDGTGPSLFDVYGCRSQDEIRPSIFASHRNVEGGPRVSILDNSAFRLIGGLEGEIDIWSWEVFGQFSRTEDIDISQNDFVVENVQQAFFLERDPDTGEVVCTDPSGGCVPYNIFERGPNGESLVTQEMVDYLIGTGIVNGETQQLVFGGSAQADLGEYGIKSPLSDSGIGFLAGLEWREDELVSIPDEISQVPGGGFTGVGGADLPVSGEVQVFEVFTEVQLPLITDTFLADELTLNGQLRFSDYETDGNDEENSFSTTAYGVQLTYAPIDQFSVRAQFQRAVRAPNVIELFSAQNTNLPNLGSSTNALGETIFDPCATTAPTATLSQCQNTGVTADQYGTIPDVIAGQTQSITGGNADLEPEVSDTITVGLIAEPTALPGLSVSVDYFDIVVEEFINAGVPAQTVLDQCIQTGNQALCDLITRAPNGSLVAGISGVGFQSTNINIAELETSGIDFQVRYRLDLADVNAGGFGAVRFDYASTYLMAFDFTPFPGADPTECAGNVTNGCLNPNNPQYRHRFLATWETPLNIEATATWRYFSSTDNPAGPAATGVDGGLDSVNYLDLSFNYEVTEFFRLRAGALNVLNRQAPVFTAAGPPLGNGNTFPTIYDTGRFVFFGGTLTY